LPPSVRSLARGASLARSRYLGGGDGAKAHRNDVERARGARARDAHRSLVSVALGEVARGSVQHAASDSSHDVPAIHRDGAPGYGPRSRGPWAAMDDAQGY